GDMQRLAERARTTHLDRHVESLERLGIRRQRPLLPRNDEEVAELSPARRSLRRDVPREFFGTHLRNELRGDMTADRHGAHAVWRRLEVEPALGARSWRHLDRRRRTRHEWREGRLPRRGLVRETRLEHAVRPGADRGYGPEVCRERHDATSVRTGKRGTHVVVAVDVGATEA